MGKHPILTNMLPILVNLKGDYFEVNNYPKIYALVIFIHCSLISIPNKAERPPPLISRLLCMLGKIVTFQHLWYVEPPRERIL